MARDFDGSNQYMRIADSSTGGLLDFGTSSFSIAAWVKPDDYGGSEANIVRKDPGGAGRGVYLVRIKQTTGELEFQVGTTVGFPTSFTTITGATPIPTSSWTHVVAVRDRGSDVIRVYVNGVEDATAVTDKDGNCDNSGSFTIGAFYDDGAVNINGSPYDGKIAEVGVWVEALSSANISALSKGFSPAFLKQNLRAYYPLIGNNSPETDLKNGLNLTLTNSPAKADHPRIIYPTGYQTARISAGGGTTNFNASVFSITATLQYPVQQVSLSPSVITASGVFQSLSDKIISQSPSVLSASGTVQAPTQTILKQLSELTATASLIAPSVGTTGDVTILVPVLSTTATINTPTGVVQKSISVIVANAAVSSPSKLINKDIAAQIATAQTNAPAIFAERNVVVTPLVLTAVAIVSPARVVIPGDSIADSVVYDSVLSADSSDSNSIADVVIYDEGTDWGGGIIE